MVKITENLENTFQTNHSKASKDDCLVQKTQQPGRGPGVRTRSSHPLAGKAWITTCSPCSLCQHSGLYLRNVGVMLRGISAIIACLPLPFISDTLDEIFVEVADVQVPYLMGRNPKSVSSTPRNL